MINKINAVNTASLCFGKIKNNHKSNNDTVDIDSKAKGKNNKLILTLSDLALNSAIFLKTNGKKIKAHTVQAKTENTPENEQTKIKNVIVDSTRQQKQEKKSVDTTVIVDAGKFTDVIKTDDEQQMPVIAEDKREQANNIVRDNNIIQKKTNNNELTLEEFQNRQGQFFNGKAYLDEKAFTGNIIVDRNNRKYTINYKKGELIESVYSVEDENGNYEPVKITKYGRKDDGTRVIEIYKKKRSLKSVDLFKEEYVEDWYKQKIIKANDSSVTILEATLFDDYLGKFFRKQKDGTWKGYYESREFDYDYGYIKVPRNIYTHEILSKKELKKFFS